MVQATPQIHELLCRSAGYTVHEIKWVPGAPRLAAVGTHASGTGTLQVLQLDGPELRQVASVEGRQQGIKCAAFHGTSAPEHLVTGDYGGALEAWDLRRAAAVLRLEAHAGIVNCVDGCGGQAEGCGPPEVASGGRDGRVAVWDVRQPGKPVASLEPPSGRAAECWSVAIGNSHSDDDRCVLAGYSDGCLRMFDMRRMATAWEARVGTGVCSVQFDRPTIKMNKFVVGCMGSRLHVFDARTQHPTRGFASLEQSLPVDGTVWRAQHLPSNRDVFMAAAGDGSLTLCKYSYPDQRWKDTKTEGREGVVGTVEAVARQQVSSQPVMALDWCPGKPGLFACSALDQCVRLGVATRVSLL